eukprot:RCo004509
MEDDPHPADLEGSEGEAGSDASEDSVSVYSSSASGFSGGVPEEQPDNDQGGEEDVAASEVKQDEAGGDVAMAGEGSHAPRAPQGSESVFAPDPTQSEQPVEKPDETLEWLRDPNAPLQYGRRVVDLDAAVGNDDELTAQPEEALKPMDAGPWEHDLFLMQEEEDAANNPKGQIYVEGQWLTAFDVFPTARSEQASELPRGFVKGMHCHAWRYKGSCSAGELCNFIHVVAEQGTLTHLSHANTRPPTKNR